MSRIMSRILVINLNPTFQQSFFYRSFQKNDVNRAFSHNEQFAGKGFNLVRILSLLGDKPVYLSHLGRSRFDEVERECRTLGITMACPISESPMRTCVTLLESDTHQTTEITCEAEPISSSGIEEEIRELFSKHISDPGIEWVIISGTQAPGYSPALFPDMVKAASSLGKRTVLDICRISLMGCLPFSPTIVKPNRKEFQTTFGIPEADDAVFQDSVRSAARKYRTTFVITCGDRGAFAAGIDDYPDGRWLPVAEYVPNPVNATGCGDVFTAGMTHKLAAGGTLEEAVMFGSQCAARRVKRMDVGL
ncbi:MAG: 1-phosphofructokinase family hexose kinase [Sphaerochaetaceae bacterium]